MNSRRFDELIAPIVRVSIRRHLPNENTIFRKIKIGNVLSLDHHHTNGVATRLAHATIEFAESYLSCVDRIQCRRKENSEKKNHSHHHVTDSFAILVIESTCDENCNHERTDDHG